MTNRLVPSPRRAGLSWFTAWCLVHLIGVDVAESQSHVLAPVMSQTRQLSFRDALDRSLSARSAARRCEDGGSDASVDRYYESTVFACAALRSARLDSWEIGRAGSLYNESLRDCLRAASRFGRIDPRFRLIVNGPSGTMDVPIVHKSFVWTSDCFAKLIDPRWARINPSQKKSHVREGLGATQVVACQNSRTTAAEQFYPRNPRFPATAVLRPDLDFWICGVPGQARDVLEFIDPLRVRCVELVGRSWNLSADPDSPLSLMEESLDSRRYTITGFINPATEINRTGVIFIEPFQPGKIVLVLIHGLLDNPFTFSDMINELRGRKDFIFEYQIAVATYPTGSSFLRSASVIRQKLAQAETVFDPARSDVGYQNMVLLGYSMGGLISKLQVTSSGDQIWMLGANRPLDSLVTTPETLELLRSMFYFEPSPFVKRVIFLATPHDGSGLATNFVGKTATRLVQRPADSLAISEQIARDNPGAIKPYLQKLPTSVDLLASNGPLLGVIANLPINPETRLHTILGKGYLPDHVARGDGVVPIRSASIPGVESETWIAALHTNIYRQEQTVAEINRILDLHRRQVMGGVEVSVGMPIRD